MAIGTRKLGKNGPELPMLGLGGQVVFQNGSMHQAERLWRSVVASGIRYIDTAHDYGDSQVRLGKLMEGEGEDFFVATKTVKRGRDAFMRELDKNIKDLRREPDLLQIHAVKRGEQQEILKSGGALDAALEARDQGLCRFVGVTGHDDMDTLWEVVRWSEGIDTVLMVLSAADTRALSKLVPYCLRHGIGTIAMKVMGRGLLVRPDGPGVQSGAEALRFVLSCPIDMAIVGFSFPSEVRECADVATDFESMTRAEMHRVVDGVASYADDMAYYRGYGSGWDKTFDIRPTEDAYVQWKRPK